MFGPNGGIFFDNVTKILTINVGWGSGAGAGFMNLTGTVTAAHIHGPASQTAAAGVLFSLGGATPGFNSSGTNGGWTNTTASTFPPRKPTCSVGSSISMLTQR